MKRLLKLLGALFKKRKSYIIDEVIDIVNIEEEFRLEDKVHQVLSNRGYTNKDMWFHYTWGELEQALVSEEIIEVVDENIYKLTKEKGRLVKDLGGYSQYLEYRQFQLSSPKRQLRLNQGLMWTNFGLLLIAIISTVAAIYFNYKSKEEKPIVFSPHIVVNVDSTFLDKLNKQDIHINPRINITIDTSQLSKKK